MLINFNLEIEDMKKIFNVLIGIWCCLVCYVSPLWLSMIFFNITGIIYKYDYSMDEGTAIALGIILLILWIVLGLIPNVYLGKKIYFVNRKYFIIYITCVIFLCISCFVMYDWNIMRFFVT